MPTKLNLMEWLWDRYRPMTDWTVFAGPKATPSSTSDHGRKSQAGGRGSESPDEGAKRGG